MSDSLVIYWSDYRQVIKAAPGEDFKAVLKIPKKGIYAITDGVNNARLILDNGFDLIMKTDAKDFAGKLTYEGVEKEIKKINGQQSPDFVYENHKGGLTTLKDFKGKYVYIDVWATWCAPCRQQIPFLKKIEKKYLGKKIEFVSISVDKAKDHDKWKKMVTDEDLGGVQLFADKDWSSAFIQSFGINSIPRFILIGPDGKVVDADAKRPSDPALQAELDTFLK